MLTLNQIRQILDESNSLKLVTQAYSEIAAIKLQKIRKGIEKNRDFFQEVSQVFRMVKVASVKNNIHPEQGKRGTISIIVTSNHRFYGGLESRLLQYFVVNTTKFKTDRLTIGKSAQEFLSTMHYTHDYVPYVFKNDLPDFNELQKLVSSLADYQQILVYYSRMQSVLVQEPHVVDVLQKPPEHYMESKEHSFDSIFEPELETMLKFFDNQITTLLLEQTFLESELARTAARLISMDRAETNAEDLIKQQRKMLFSAKKSIDNNRLLDMIAALTAVTGAKHGNN